MSERAERLLVAFMDFAFRLTIIAALVFVMTEIAKTSDRLTKIEASLSREVGR